MMTELNGLGGRDGNGPLLLVDTVTVQFGGITALRDVSLEVGPASVVGLVGPNGAGKSTLFDVISGFRRPVAGLVSLNGIDLTTLKPQGRAAHGLARTFQHPALFTGLTVRQHLLLADRLYRVRGALHKRAVFLRSALRASDSESARIDRLLELLDLTRLGDEEVSGLPLGPSRLLEVGRALASQPSLVLLDEPSSGLDPHETAELVSVFRQAVNEHGTSLLLVEHDVEMVLGLSDTVYVLDAGNLICEGPPALVRSDPLVIAAYLGTASQGDGRL